MADFANDHGRLFPQKTLRSLQQRELESVNVYFQKSHVPQVLLLHVVIKSQYGNLKGRFCCFVIAQPSPEHAPRAKTSCPAVSPYLIHPYSARGLSKSARVAYNMVCLVCFCQPPQFLKVRGNRLKRVHAPALPDKPRAQGRVVPNVRARVYEHVPFSQEPPHNAHNPQLVEAKVHYFLEFLVFFVVK